MKRLMQTTALGLLLGFFLPAPGPIFVYKSLHAASSPTIPEWVQASCCGPQDAHRLRADQVYQNDDGTWHADGYPGVITAEATTIKGSQDVNAWAFYNEHTATTGGMSKVYCLFFVPSI